MLREKTVSRIGIADEKRTAFNITNRRVRGGGGGGLKQPTQSGSKYSVNMERTVSTEVRVVVAEIFRGTGGLNCNDCHWSGSVLHSQKFLDSYANFEF